MDNIATSIKDRVLQIAKCKGISYEKFCEDIGMTYGSFKGIAKSRPLNSDAVEIIIRIHQDINATWLITGEGDMYKSGNKSSGYTTAIDQDYLSSNKGNKLLDDNSKEVDLIQTFDNNNKLIDANTKLAEASLLLAETNSKLAQRLIDYQEIINKSTLPSS